MTDMDEARASAMAAVTSINRQLSTWLIDAALPVWDEHGVDRRGGGYYETLSYDESTRRFDARGTLRRGRVVARQIYVFGVGEARGWRSARSSPLAHGCEHLFSRFHLGDGVFHTAIDARTGEPGSPFSLYEQSFYLFALARVTAAFGQRYPVAESALRCLQRLRGRFASERGGFYETDPPQLPLKSNPHMHLLEAALEWVQNTEGPRQRAWIGLAQEIVGLCLTHFRDARSGAVREYFDFQWRAMPGDDGRIVEPGHQFEWAWLLLRWAATPHCEAGEAVICRAAAARLVELAEEHGVDVNRGVAINEMWDDMTAKDLTAKLWPQTERLKAWCAVLDAAVSAREVEHATPLLIGAAAGLVKYLSAPTPGLWYETCLPNGDFIAEPSKASSLYHIVGAIEAVGKTVAAATAAQASR